MHQSARSLLHFILHEMFLQERLLIIRKGIKIEISRAKFQASSQKDNCHEYMHSSREARVREVFLMLFLICEF